MKFNDVHRVTNDELSKVKIYLNKLCAWNDNFYKKIKKNENFFFISTSVSCTHDSILSIVLNRNVLKWNGAQYIQKMWIGYCVFIGKLTDMIWYVIFERSFVNQS